MTAVSLFILQTSVFLLKSQKCKHSNLQLLFFLYLASFISLSLAENKVSVKKIKESELKFTSVNGKVVLQNVKGTFAGTHSNVKTAQGEIHQVAV